MKSPDNLHTFKKMLRSLGKLPMLVSHERILMKRFFLAAALILISSSLFAEEYPWELKKEEQGIQVAVRRVENSPILEYKGTMVIPVSIEKALAFYEDETRMTEWFHQASESKLLKENSADDKILYFAIDLPWPVRDRDTIYHRIRTRNASTGVVEYKTSAAIGDYPEKDGRLRMPVIKGLWRFTPLDEGRTEVYYQQHGDTGGHIPAWLVNKLAVNIPYNSFLKFREILSQESSDSREV